MNNVLALDVSTSIVGCSIINKDTEELISLFHVDLRKIKGLVNKANVLRNELAKNAPPGIVNEVAIEEAAMNYKKGNTSIQTTILLATFNGMVQIVAASLYGVEPAMYNVDHARAITFPKTKYPPGVPRKEVIFGKVSEKYKQIEWKKKKTGTFKDECYDMADSIVVGVCHCRDTR